MLTDLIREIGQTLRNNRLRTCLTGSAVAWGIFMLIVLLGAVKGLENAFVNNSNADDASEIQIWGGLTNKPYQGYKDGRAIKLRDSDMATLRNKVPGATAAQARLEGREIVSTPRHSVSSGFEATYPRPLDEYGTITYGRALNNLDIDNLRRVIMIDDKNAELLFEDSSKAVGSTVNMFGLAWTVVGVYNHRWRDDCYIPYTTYKALTGFNDEADCITVKFDNLKDEAGCESAEDAVRNVLAKKHSFDPDDRGALWVWNRFSSYLTNLKAYGYISLAGWILGLLTLVSGIVGVSNIMFVSVRERTHEIGIRRAIGAKPRSILVQVVAESITITTLFGYIGIVLGMGALKIIDILFHNPQQFSHPSVDLAIALEVTVALVICGAIAGIFPAHKATQVKPVEALRDE